MRIFGSMDSGTQRGLFLALGVGILGLGILFLLVVFSPERKPRRLLPKKSLVHHSMDVKTEAEPGFYVEPDAPVVRKASPVNVSRSLNRTTVRGILVRLKTAAATGNDGLKYSMFRALGRYRKEAPALLREEISRTESEIAREALEEALAYCR